MSKTIAEMIAEQKKSMRDTVTKERKELRTLETLAKVLPADIKPDSVHVHTLYGSQACLTFGDRYSSYGPETKLTVQQVAELLDLFPPVKVWIVKDGCTALRPDWDLSDQEVEEKRDTLKDCWGAMLKVEPGINSGGASQSVKWFTERDGMRFEIVCNLQSDHWPVSVSTRSKQDPSGRTYRVEDTMIQPRGSFWMDQQIKWGRGGEEYAHTFTCYWLAIDDSRGAGKAWLEQICGQNFPPKSGHFQHAAE